MTAELASKNSSSPGELRWRCRRGMLELDLILQAFVNKGMEQLSETELSAFDRLLDYPDQLLLELFLKQTLSSDKEISQLVERIRQSARS